MRVENHPKSVEQIELESNHNPQHLDPLPIVEVDDQSGQFAPEQSQLDEESGDIGDEVETPVGRELLEGLDFHQEMNEVILASVQLKVNHEEEEHQVICHEFQRNYLPKLRVGDREPVPELDEKSVEQKSAVIFFSKHYLKEAVKTAGGVGEIKL